MNRNDPELFKTYIMEAFILLLEEKSFSEITIKEITKKAGVNRSTYYRNFDSKEDIIIFFYQFILKKCLSNEDLEGHLTNIFNQFLIYQRELLCLHQNNLSHFLLSVLNSFFIEQMIINGEVDFEKDFALRYHSGGVFNTLLLWFDYKMEIEPKYLVKKSIEILPNNFQFFLIK